MSVLRFIVTKQKLVEDGQPFVVANSREYLSVAFDFSSAWNDCIKTVVFRKASGETFSVILEEENSCTVPWEVIECPHFTVSVYGICGTERITTNQVVVKVEICGYEEGKTPEEPTPTVYETIADQLNSIEKRFENYGTASLCDTGTSAGNVPVLNDEGKLEESVIPSISSEETDPIFTASAAFRITDENIESWNTKFTFSGDYNDLTNKPTKLSEFDNDAGYLDTETDPVFTASPAHGITDEDIEKWNSSTGFSGDYNDLTNKPEIPGALTDLTGTLPIAQGGTGATTADKALTNLGAAKSADIGDVTTLATTDKTVVGAINEMQAGIGDVETALTAIIGGAG